MSWEEVRLADVAFIDRTSLKPDQIRSGTKYLGLEHIESGGRILQYQVVESGELRSAKFHFSSEHILYGKLRPYLAKIAKPDFDGICSTDIIPILPTKAITRSYLLHFLRQGSMVEHANSLATGANLPRISPKSLAKLKIPLPSLAEQRRIAGILDQADALRSQRQHALDHLNQLGQSIFYEMFGDPDDDHNPLDKSPFTKVFKDVTRAVSKVQKSDYLLVGDVKIIDQGKDEVAGWVAMDKKLSVCEGERIIFGDHTRKVSYVDFPFVAGADGVKVLQARAGFIPRFLADLLSLMKIESLGYSRHMKILKSSMYLKPAGDLQEDYVRRIKALDHAKLAMRDHRNQADHLFASLQQRAFAEKL